MKKIIAPIDFSDSSLNALAFAAELAKRTSAGLIIIHVPSKGEEDSDAEKKLKSARDGLAKTFGAELKCETSVMHGNLVSAMKEVIASQNPDLIVMGTKGATGLKRILIGSSTVSVMAKTRFPVLVIPGEARFESFLRKGKSRIILATNLDEPENENALDILKEIALMIVEPKVRVLNVRPKKTSLNFFGKLERDRLLSLFSPVLESERVTVFSDNVIRGINFYINKHDDVGLVAMLANDSGQLIQKHYTRAMASHTHIPLLVLHNKKRK
jgi:nucleotide-binding universal stress UspA family protein